jgi:hypothetical protein
MLTGAELEMQSPDPSPVGMSDEERDIVMLAASLCDRALEPWMTKLQTFRTITLGQAIAESTHQPEYLTWGPPSAVRQQSVELAKEREAIVQSQLQVLKLQLGESSFHVLDDYVHKLYHASPGQLVWMPLPDSNMYYRYLHYLAALDKLAAEDTEGGKEAAKLRAREQKASGLSDKCESILLGLPVDFQQADIELFKLKLGKACFQKLDKRVHEFYVAFYVDRVIDKILPLSASQEQIKARESLRVAP